VAKAKTDPTTLLQALFTTGALVELLVDEELEAARVPPRLFSLLAWIDALGPLSPSALSAESGMPPTTLRDNIRRLVARGDVRRVPNPEDGRSYLVELTAKGKAKMRAGRRPLRVALDRMIEHLPRPAGDYLAIAHELHAAAAAALRRDGARPERAVG
jgi:DNA-binding MarR family transcriptional regulator